jgi:hypothetical protein
MSDIDRSKTGVHDIETQAFHEVCLFFLLCLPRTLRIVQNAHVKGIRVNIAKYSSASFSHSEVLIVISLASLLLICPTSLHAVVACGSSIL